MKSEIEKNSTDLFKPHLNKQSLNIVIVTLKHEILQSCSHRTGGSVNLPAERRRIIIYRGIVVDVVDDEIRHSRVDNNILAGAITLLEIHTVGRLGFDPIALTRTLACGWD